ncbi:MAG: hypothetical protein ACRDX8_03205, partial [Acidimicrobiales bacterium]
PPPGPPPAVLIADPVGVEHAATEHLVGDCLINLLGPGGAPLWHATLRRQPSRITSDQHRWLLEELRRRGGTGVISDPYGRSQIWLELAPEVPTTSDERARIAVLLWARCADALRAIASAPVTVLREDFDWRGVRGLAGVPARRIDGRRLRPWDPPHPLPRPMAGVVLVERTDEQVDSAENRFALATAQALGGLLEASARDPEVSVPVAQPCRLAAAQLGRWFGSETWRDMATGPFPAESFLIRDHPAYQSVAGLAVLLADLPGALLGLPQLDLAMPLSPPSLNVLYERWVGVCAVEWAEARLGTLSRPAVPSGGVFSWRQGDLLVRLCIDFAYPRSAHAGVVCPEGKNRPDVAIELHRPGRRAQVATLDATYSRNEALHAEKLTYSRTLRDAGWQAPLTGLTSPCVSWSAVAYPGRLTFATERRADLSEAILSLPPCAESEALLRRWLDETVGARI